MCWILNVAWLTVTSLSSFFDTLCCEYKSDHLKTDISNYMYNLPGVDLQYQKLFNRGFTCICLLMTYSSKGVLPNEFLSFATDRFCNALTEKQQWFQFLQMWSKHSTVHELPTTQLETEPFWFHEDAFVPVVCRFFTNQQMINIFGWIVTKNKAWMI